MKPTLARRIYQAVGFLAIIGATFLFLWRDLVWSGTWVVRQDGGQKTPTISAPWPAAMVHTDPTGFTVDQSSVYFTVAIPRTFSNVDVQVDTSAAGPIEIGVETIPNTLRYHLVPALSKYRTIEMSNWRVDLPLEGVDQRQGTMNFVVRFAGDAARHPHVSAIAFAFHRPPLSITAFVSKLWDRLVHRG